MGEFWLSSERDIKQFKGSEERFVLIFYQDNLGSRMRIDYGKQRVEAGKLRQEGPGAWCRALEEEVRRSRCILDIF